MSFGFSRRGVDEKRIWTIDVDWIMSTVHNGKVCINIDGVNEPYFKTHRG